MDSKNLYIVLAGSTTGDLWHLAAADILAKEFDKQFPKIVVVIAITPLKKEYQSDKGKELAKEERSYGKVNFNYFQGIGLESMLVQIDYEKKEGANDGGPAKEDIDKIMYKQPTGWYDHLYNEYREHKLASLGFDEHKDKGLVSKPAVPFFKEETVDSSRVLKLMNATTIAMNLLCSPDVDKRLAHLSSRMSSIDGKPTESVFMEAKAKYDDLSAIIETTLSKPGKKGQKLTRVVLENYRIGHVNAGTDSTLSISDWFQELAEDRGLAVIRVLSINLNSDRGKSAMSSLEGKYVPLFDLYNKNKQAAFPGIENRAQCLFWHMVANDSRIVGLFGGRSGSVDVAGFNGVSVFFWDEPWIEWAAGKKLDAEMGTYEDFSTRSKAGGQIHQCLRSLQLLAIMSVGYPEAKIGDDVKTKEWSKVRPEELHKWLVGICSKEKLPRGDIQKAIYPALAPVQTWKMEKSLNNYRKEYLEHLPELTSTVLNKIPNYQSDEVRPP
ncbi:hypothetical protein M501DRAFT_998548, partial [Patellaria atrata CBS 101060]